MLEEIVEEKKKKVSNNKPSSVQMQLKLTY